MLAIGGLLGGTDESMAEGLHAPLAMGILTSLQSISLMD